MTQTNRYQIRIEILDELEKQAGPSELVYYKNLRERYKNAFNAAPQSFQEEGDESQRKISELDRLYDYLHWYEYLLSKADSDIYWTNYSKDRIKDYEEKISSVEVGLGDLGIVYKKPAFNALKYENEDKLLKIEGDIESQTRLYELLNSWCEKHGYNAKEQKKLESIKSKLEELETALTNTKLSIQNRDKAT